MRNAISQGVLVVKAAGNDGGDGPFRADAYTAAGSITAASVGDDVGFVPLNSRLVAAHFSSYGPVSWFEKGSDSTQRTIASVVSVGQNVS